MYLLVPLQQHSAAVVGGLLEARVDVLHEQVYATAVQSLNSLLYVTALEAAQHPQHQRLCPILGGREMGRERWGREQ